jgi:hypothetical protein
MTTFLIITGIVILLIVILNFIKTPNKKESKSLMDEINEIPTFQKQKKLYEAMESLNGEGIEVDTLEDGYGEFGHDITNPIPTNTPFGSIDYLESLSTIDGTKVEYERFGSMSSPNIDYPVNKYIISENGEEIATLYITTRNKKNSERAPKGFKLAGIL